MLTTELVQRVLTTIPGRTVGVLGDLFLDRYLDIDSSLNELSVETHITAYQVVRVRSYPGAAGTVINNLAALGVGRIYPIACIGDDGEGYELRQALRLLPAVELGGIIQAPQRRTPTYTKPMVGQTELNRLDIKNRTPTPDAIQEHVIELLDEAWPQLDALLVLDQVSEDECGVVTKRVRDHVAKLAEADATKFVLADSRERIGLFRNVCIKPNENEFAKCFDVQSRPIPWSPTILLDIAYLARRPMFYTGGASGIQITYPLASAEDPGSQIERADAVGQCFASVSAYPVPGPIDICGAGDSCSAGIASAMVSGLTHEQAAAFGNLVASITIQQIGVTGVATPAQVRDRWRAVSGPA